MQGKVLELVTVGIFLTTAVVWAVNTKLQDRKRRKQIEELERRWEPVDGPLELGL